jgi:transposase
MSRHSPAPEPQVDDTLRPAALPQPPPHRECLCRIKGFRHIATRYEKLAANFLSAMALVTAVAFWI